MFKMQGKGQWKLIIWLASATYQNSVRDFCQLSSFITNLHNICIKRNELYFILYSWNRHILKHQYINYTNTVDFHTQNQ